MRPHGKELLFHVVEEEEPRVPVESRTRFLCFGGSGHSYRRALYSKFSLLEARGRSVSLSSLIWATSCSFCLFL